MAKQANKNTENKVISKPVLFRDETMLARMQQIEKSLFDNYIKLNAIFESVVGKNKVKNWSDVLLNAEDFIINLYWDTHGKQYNPIGSDRKKVLVNTTSINLARVYNLAGEINNALKQMGQFSPSLGKKIISTIKPEMFDRTLKDGLEAQYAVVENIVNSANAMQDDGFFHNNMGYHIKRFAGEWVSVTGTGQLEVNKARFSDPIKVISA